MSIRDDEIKRIEQYCKGLGIKVSYKEYKQGCPQAEWSANPAEITIYRQKGLSKTQLVLNFLHELGHHFDYVHGHNRKPNDRVEKAWLKENNNEELNIDQRYLIYEDEKRASEYRKTIAHELGLKISEQKIDLDIKLDLFTYEYFYKNGNYPTRKITADKRREFKQKWKTTKV